jgi:hypothetical protein
MIEIFLKEDPEIIYRNSRKFIELFTVLLMIPIVFREDKDFNKQVYLLLHKLALPIAKHPKRYDITIKQDMVSLMLFKQMIETCNYNVKSLVRSSLTDEQKLLFELFLLLRRIDQSIPDFATIYQYTDKLMDIERSITILKEKKEFKMISYLLFFNNHLTDEQKNKIINIETFHNMLDRKVSAMFSYEGFKKIHAKINPMSAIEALSSIAITSDSEGYKMIKRFTQSCISDKKTEFTLYTNKFFIHYPYNPPRIICFGEGHDYKLGNNSTSTTNKPSEIQDYYQGVKQIVSIKNFTAILSEDNILYYSGFKSSGGIENDEKCHKTMKKYTNELPDEKIVQIAAGVNNFCILSESGKIYVDGFDIGYHLDDNSKKT